MFTTLTRTLFATAIALIFRNDRTQNSRHNLIPLGTLPSRKTRDFRPVLEPLEDRVVLDAYSFNGAQNNLWSNAGNWRDDTNPANVAVPGFGDDATIPAGTRADVG